MKKQIFTILGLLIFFGLFAQEIPQKISYQGKLLENAQEVNGTKSIIFTIGTWNETHSNVQVTDGLYSVTLGETTPIPTSIFNNSSSVSLQISVEGTTLSPQTDVLSVPYAYKAEKAVDAEKIAGNTVSTTSPSTAQVLKWNGTQWTPQTDENDGLTLPYSGTYSESGDAFQITDPATGALARFITSSGNVLHLDADGSSLGSADVFHIYNAGSNDAINIENDVNAGQAIMINNFSAQQSIMVNHDGSNDAVAIKNWGNNNALNINNYGTGLAAYFDGDVEVTGTLTGGKSYAKIDHPLDPENKYLFHSFIESPDMMNVYNGNIVLDKNGEATIELPIYFEALNKEFRYQLTCIGGYAPVYVAKEISDNRFKISGGKEGMKISWQVTGVRQDSYANQNRIPVEVEKTEKEKGHYLHYKVYNQPIEKSIKAVKNPEMLEELNK